MMPTGRRMRRFALLAGQALVVLLLLVSPRAMFKPVTIVHKSQDSKRPKTPKNVVRAEPVRIPAAEKQPLGPSPARLDAAAENVLAGLARSSRRQALPRQAFTQLTKPEYLKSYSAGLFKIPLSPPA